jgi:hypothetical protein
MRKAWDLIQQARSLPIPDDGGIYNFSYVAQVKAFLQEARNLVKFIPKTPSATTEIKDEVIRIFQECENADREILHPNKTIEESS